MKLLRNSSVLALVLIACSSAAPSGDTTPEGGLPPVTPSPDDGSTPPVGPQPEGGPDAPVSCAEAQKRCAVDFAYSPNADSVVEIRGNWGPTTWAAGEPMTNFGPQWRRTLFLVPGSSLEYKYCIDPASDGTCARWETDASKPTTGAESNNVIAKVSCAETVCLPDKGPIVQPLRFIAVGDTGYDGPNSVSAAMAAKCQASGCDFVLLLGDNVYDSGASSPTDPQLTSKFENRFAAVHTPFEVVLGNHDYGGNGDGSEYDKAQNEVDYTQHSKKWKMPSRYYRFAAGNVDFFALDTNAQMYSLDAQQKIDVKGWITQSQAPWKIAFGHHPYMSNGPHGNAGVYDNDPARPIFNGVEVKSFAENVWCGAVDLYLCGHDHSRQWMTDTCKGTELAISGAGAAPSTLGGTDPARFQSIDLGFLYVTIDGKTLTAEFMNPSGGVDFTRVLTKP